MCYRSLSMIPPINFGIIEKVQEFQQSKIMDVSYIVARSSSSSNWRWLRHTISVLHYNTNCLCTCRSSIRDSIRNILFNQSRVIRIRPQKTCQHVKVSYHLHLRQPARLQIFLSAKKDPCIYLSKKEFNNIIDISCWTVTKKNNHHSLKGKYPLSSWHHLFLGWGNQFKAIKCIFKYRINCFRIGINSISFFQEPSGEV
jgi:hypothetical protein